jgi:hypothetical protein
MILTELGRPDLAARYRWDEPWDGPNNRLLHSEAVKLFQCPSDTGSSATTTSYVAVVGPGTMFPGASSVRRSQITDSEENTLLLVEVRGGGFNWFEPRDLHVTQMAAAINGKQGQGPSSGHVSGVNAAFADFSTRFLPNELPPETLRGLLTISGGEPVEPP